MPEHTIPDQSQVTVKTWMKWILGGERAEDKRVMLPMMQRGSVWKPSQIIDLWDSLLRGMPIGAVIVGKITSNENQDISMINMLSRKTERVNPQRVLSLIDGQQRSMAMLIGAADRNEQTNWSTNRGNAFAQRVWVDFESDKRTTQHLYRFRVTSLNQPFGTSPNAPDSPLSLHEKRSARRQFGYLFNNPDETSQNFVFRRAIPFPVEKGICVPLDLLIKARNTLRNIAVAAYADEYENYHLGLIREFINSNVKKVKAYNDADASVDFESIFTTQTKVYAESIRRLASHPNQLDTFFERIDAALSQVVPLIYLDKRILSLPDEAVTKQGSPDTSPLAILFHRIGNNFTKLSDSDYVFAVLKNLKPEFHTYVETLLSRNDCPVSAMLTPTDLAVSAVRLTAAEFYSINKNVFADRVVPDANSLHNMLKDKTLLLDKKFTDRLSVTLSASFDSISTWFDQINNVICYNQQTNRLGLPIQLFPHLGAPLVQVLLRMAQRGWMKVSDRLEVLQLDILRLCIFWLICVSDKNRASIIAFKVIRESSDPSFIFENIYRQIIKEKRAIPLESPCALNKIDNLIQYKQASQHQFKLPTWNQRFQSQPDCGDLERRLRHFYHNWWQPWIHCHPVLLWLQRDYVFQNHSKDQVFADQLEDTAFDYDHIIPSAAWAYWTGKGGIPNTFPKDFSRIGNGLGNVRIWNASDNRSLGDATIQEKFNFDENGAATAESKKLLMESAIDVDDETIANFRSASPDTRDVNFNRMEFWNDSSHADSFLKAVETRTFRLYQWLWNDLQLTEKIISLEENR